MSFYGDLITNFVAPDVFSTFLDVLIIYVLLKIAFLYLNHEVMELIN